METKGLQDDHRDQKQARKPRPFDEVEAIGRKPESLGQKAADKARKNEAPARNRERGAFSKGPDDGDEAESPHGRRSDQLRDRANFRKRTIAVQEASWWNDNMSGKTENLNPISKSGQLSSQTFALSLIALVVLNLVVYAGFSSQLLGARASLDPTRIAVVYGGWILFAIPGFTMTCNTVIKRWAAILDQENLGAGMRTLIRVSMLSGLLSLPLVLVTALFFPGSPVASVRRGGSKAALISLLLGAMVLSVAVSVVLPRSWFGLEKIDFRRSVEPFAAAGFSNSKNLVPSEKIVQPVLAAMSPAFRYASWLGLDYLRLRALASAVNAAPESVCTERMGYMGIEVPDCYFWNLRSMTNVAPLASPLFAFFYETKYRQQVLTDINVQRGEAMQSFASSMLVISNQIELIEATKMIAPISDFVKPSWLLHAFGSPEIPLLRLSFDGQRLALRDKILPIVEMQMSAVQGYIEKSSSVLQGGDDITVRAEMRDLTNRVERLRRDPFALAP